MVTEGGESRLGDAGRFAEAERTLTSSGYFKSIGVIRAPTTTTAREPLVLDHVVEVRTRI